jgi:hypothetical protein
MRTPKAVHLRIQPKPDVEANPPNSCVQQSVTVAPEGGAKFHQELPYGSAEWHAAYSTLRNGIEGMNGYVKDGAHEALTDPSRRRIHGVAAQSIFAAFILFAANLRKIEAFVRTEESIEAGVRIRPRGRRTTRSLQNWQPSTSAPEGRAQPAPG